MGRGPPPSDILAARRAALLLVLGMIVGGTPTLSRFAFAGVVPLVASPLVVPLSLLSSEDKLRGLELGTPPVLNLEVEREIGGRAELLA